MVLQLSKVLVFLVTTISFAAQATVTVAIAETGGDVVATASGSLDISGATNLQPGGVCQSGPIVSSLLEYDASDDQYYGLGPTTDTPANICLGLTLSTAQSLFSSFTLIIPDSGTGDPLVIEISPSGFNLFVPDGYTSGAPLSSTSTWSGTTLSSLGLTPGNYLFDYGDDQITFVVANPTASTPTPIPALQIPFLGLLAAFVLGLGLSRLRRG